LEDLHARRLRGLDVPLPVVLAQRPAARARLPLPLLDLRPRARRQGDLRAGRAPAAPAARRDRRERRDPRRRPDVGARRPVVVGGAGGVIYRLVRYLDTRTGRTPLLKTMLRYVFPDHWSFLLGEIALYCFVVLV